MNVTTTCILVNVLGGLLLGFGAIGINTALGPLYTCCFKLLPEAQYSWQLACLIASVNVGAALGAVFGGTFSDHYGRKPTMVIGGVFCFASVFSLFWNSYYWHLASRVVTGLGVGLTSSTCGSYVSEMAPSRKRGSLGTLYQVFITVGIFLASLVSYVVLGADRDLPSDEYCQALSTTGVLASAKVRILTGIFLSIALVFTAFTASPLTPESNSWIARKDALRRRPKKSFLLLFSASRPLAICVANACALQLTGINAVMFYCAKFLEASNVSQKILGTVCIMFWNFVTTLISLALSDRAGRRKLLVPSVMTLTLSMFLLTVVVRCAPFMDRVTCSVISFLLLAIYIAAFEIGPGTLFWVVCNEVFPEELSQLGFGFINALQWGFTLLVTFTFPSLQNTLGPYVFLIFGVPGAFITAFLYLCLPETKQRSRASIAAELAGKNWLVVGPTKPSRAH
ncbi:sugar transporter family protein [Perkinsela sp. CCAP 1560/4]|nr:sugar transporter family protein [Perkinsela sp. CCAP 1560/4]|eukprot:KNH06405.1 sugar transporter family protein [Perkinsela sp. CCAP 1560/4]